MVDEETLISFRDDAIKVCDIIDLLSTFSDVNAIVEDGVLGPSFTEFDVPDWLSRKSKVTRYHLARCFWGSPVHYCFAFDNVYRECVNASIEYPDAEESRFIALANGIDSPRYRTLNHYRVAENYNGEWTTTVKTAHEVAASLWEQKVQMLKKHLPCQPARGQRKGDALRKYVFDMAQAMDEWNPRIDLDRLREAIRTESMRAIHTANGVPFPPIQFADLTDFLTLPSSNQNHVQPSGSHEEDGPAQKGIKLNGIVYSLTPRALRIVKLCWTQEDKSIPILEASDDHAIEMTLDQAKARQKDFNRAVVGSGWEMSLEKERFTIRKIQ